MPAAQPLRSAAYWRDFHRQRALRRDQGPNGGRFRTFGAVATAHPIVTFIPNRAAPVYSLAQNDGTLIQSYHPSTIQTTPPIRNAAERAKPAISKPSTATMSSSASAASGARARTSTATRGKTPRPPKLTAEEDLMRRIRARAAAQYVPPVFVYASDGPAFGSGAPRPKCAPGARGGHTSRASGSGSCHTSG